MDYAAAATSKDNSIPKTYFQIKNKPGAKEWLTVYDKELNKLINIGKMGLVSRSNIKSENVIPIMEMFTKKKDNITNTNIFKCRFVAHGDLQQEYLKFYSPTARLELIRIVLFTVSSKNMK
eukprot:snap_masked-scaffold_39-processed-gene-1.34-mRNA-1 protein AED:1.00 eAED:1.00 QI:0/-1/0/0/-1/1/1/0/120